MKVCPECDTELTKKDEFGSNYLCPNEKCREMVVSKEAEFETIEVPECWKYFDGRDNSCKKCKIKGYCVEAQAQDRQHCFARYDVSIIECKICLDASQCQEQQNKENKKMATVTVRKRGGTRRQRGGRQRQQKEAQPKAAPVVEEEVEEVEEAEEGQDYGSMRIADLRELAEERDLDPKGRKSVLIQRLLADDEGLVDTDDGEEEVEEKPTRRPAARQRRRKAAPVVKAEPVVEEVEEVEEVEVGDDVFSELLARLQSGEALTFSAIDDGYVVSVGGSITAATVVKKSGAGLKGRAFEEEAFSEEYFSHLYVDAASTGKGWKELTPEERYEAADEIGASWEEHENEKTDQMRMGLAVRKKLGIEKWKSEYTSRAARKALKDG